MECNKFRELIFEYLDGELDDNTVKEFEKHMKSCENCKKELDAYKKIIESVGEMPMEELPNGYCGRLHEKLNVAAVESKRKKRNNIFKFVGIAACFFVVAIGMLATGIIGFNLIGAKSSYNGSMTANYDRATMPSDYNGNAGVSYNVDGNIVAEADIGEIIGNRGYDNEGNGQTSTKMSNFSNKDNKKIITKGSVSLETYDFDQFSTQISSLVRENNGYFQYSETSVYKVVDDKEYKTGSYTIRIPQDRVDTVVGSIEGLYRITNKSINETDVTKYYYDKKNVVTNLEIQEKRLRELYEKAVSLTEILELENEIRRIRTEIDSYNMDLSNIDDLSAMATLELYVREVDKPVISISKGNKVWNRAVEGLVDTINNLIYFAEELFIFIVSSLPVLIVLAVIVFVIVLIVKRKKRKNK